MVESLVEVVVNLSASQMNNIVKVRRKRGFEFPTKHGVLFFLIVVRPRVGGFLFCCSFLFVCFGFGFGFLLFDGLGGLFGSGLVGEGIHLFTY